MVLPATIAPVRIPLRNVGSVNAWLLRGDPLTLLDTGPLSDRALEALERGLLTHGVRVEDIELVLATHHHLDHVGLAATVRRRSGAQIATLDVLADYGAHYEVRAAADRAYAQALMAEHGVPAQVIADTEGFWDFIRSNSESFQTDIRLVDGDTVRAGGRTLRVVARSGHSATDTLLVDDAARVAFVGDHVLAGISSNTEIAPTPESADTRARSRAIYLDNLEKTAAMPLEHLLTGHGLPVQQHARLIRRRRHEHERRSQEITAILRRGPRTAYDIAGELWPAAVVREQAVLVLWEVLGHLDVMLSSQTLHEERSADGHSWFRVDDIAA